MSSAVFSAPLFLDARTCRDLRRAMDAGTVEPAEVLHQEMRREDDVRRASNVEVDQASLASVERRLDGHRAAIGAFFGLRLGDREGASFLRYMDGDFYRPHRDRGVVESWPDAARRQVAVVLFLNSSRDADNAGGFSGGDLRLFVDGESPVAVHPSEGLLIAFPADVLHEVSVVRGGTRDAIVDWFYDAGEEGEARGPTE